MKEDKGKKDQEKVKRVTITIVPSLIEKAKEDAKKEGRSLSNYISYLISKNKA